MSAVVRPADWTLAQEAPVALSTNGCPRGVFMVTPADYEDFATGFLWTERIVATPDAITAIKVDVTERGTILDVRARDADLAPPDWRARRLSGRSSCGLCGIEDLEAALPPLPKLAAKPPSLAALLRAMADLPAYQPLNRANHSVHAAAWVGLDGAIRLAREDVGRHNALDKLVGAMMRADLSPDDGFLLLSSRCSYEMVQKAAMAGMACILSLSAPTALAVDLAAGAGMALFARSGGSAVRLA
jgi:FdhD protein